MPIKREQKTITPKEAAVWCFNNIENPKVIQRDAPHESAWWLLLQIRASDTKAKELFLKEIITSIGDEDTEDEKKFSDDGSELKEFIAQIEVDAKRAKEKGAVFA